MALLTEAGLELAAQARTLMRSDLRRRLGALCVAMSLALMTVVGSGSAGAGWRDSVKGLRIGVIGADNPVAAVRRMKPFADFLEKKLRIGVETVVLRSYNAVIEAQSDGRIDIATHSASTYIAARAHCSCIEAVAVPRAEDGTTHFYGVALTRKTDNVADLNDLNGRTVALGDRRATAAYRVPAAVLGLQGETISGFFGETEIHDNHVAAIEALMARRVDAVFTWSSMIGDLAAGYSRGPLRRAVMERRIKMSQIDIVWKSLPIPHGPVTIRADLPEDLKVELERRILNLHDRDADAYFALEPWFGFGLERPDAEIFTAFATLMGYPEPDAPASGDQPAEPTAARSKSGAGIGLRDTVGTSD